MGGFSLWHILIFAIILLLLFGGNRFSAMMGDVAKGLKSFKRAWPTRTSAGRAPRRAAPAAAAAAAADRRHARAAPPPIRRRRRRRRPTTSAPLSRRRPPMFGVDSSELLVVAVVALLFIGPKELPRAMLTVGRWVGRVRGMARHFTSGVENVIREAELEEMEQKWREENERILARLSGRRPLSRAGDDRAADRLPTEDQPALPLEAPAAPDDDPTPPAERPLP